MNSIQPSKSIDCIFCAQPKASYWFNQVSKLNGCLYHLYKCKNCRGAFVFPIPEASDLDFYYSDLENSAGKNTELDEFYQAIKEEMHYPNTILDAERIAKEISKISNGGKLLDIGGGYGFFSRELIMAGFDVDSIELNARSRRIFKKINGFEPECLSFNSEFARNNASKYDVVLISQVLEHLPINCLPIENIHTVMKKNAICAVAVPHFNSYISILQGKKDMFIVPPEHINFFSIKSLKEAFKLAGFEVISFKTVSRYNYQKMALRFGALSFFPIILLKLFFRLSDFNVRGIFINAYFKK